jgi:hypothetical protein
VEEINFIVFNSLQLLVEAEPLISMGLGGTQIFDLLYCAA